MGEGGGVRKKEAPRHPATHTGSSGAHIYKGCIVPASHQRCDGRHCGVARAQRHRAQCEKKRQRFVAPIQRNGVGQELDSGGCEVRVKARVGLRALGTRRVGNVS